MACTNCHGATPHAIYDIDKHTARVNCTVCHIPYFAKVAATDDGIPGTPPVNYTPGLNPDIVQISLDNNRFKESTTPEPIVVRKDELMETWFDVITYNLPSGESIGTFQRREEFVSISCACTLRAADGGGDDGRRPAGGPDGPGRRGRNRFRCGRRFRYRRGHARREGAGPARGPHRRRPGRRHHPRRRVDRRRQRRGPRD